MAYHHYDTFREELLKAYPAFGHALWEPNPGEYPPVEVGDVGFIREGQFHRLFNALLPEDHESHERFGVPDDHEPLQPMVANHINRGVLTPNTLYSSGVTVLSGGFEVLAATTIGSADVSFSCTRKQGAILSLPVAAQREDTLTRDHFREWITKHIESWFAFTQRLRLGVEMEDIVLVTGCHRTRSWSNITFNEVRTSAQFSLGVNVAGASGASVSWRASSLRIQGAVLSQGPSGENLPENQCIFIRGFRMKRIFFGTIPRIRGAAEPKPDRENDRGPEKKVVSIPGFTEYQDPLHVLLKHIANHAPDCDMALVHDDDLERIMGVGDSTSLDTFQPDMVMDYLEKLKPEIESTAYSSPANDTIPRIDAGHVTVAMLSAQLKSLDVADSALRCDTDLVHDDNRERILGTDDRTSLEPSQPIVALDSLSRVPDVGADPDAMDWAPHEMSTGAMFGSWFINDQILNTEQVTVADSERLESLVDTPCGSYYCEMCDKRFGRLQELTRHKSQVHHPPRHCPFCPYLWKRPDKIKNHILYTHPEFSHKTLKGLRGKDIVEFLNTYENLSRDVIPQAGGSSALLFPVPTEETTELPILPHPLPDYDIGGA